MAFNKNTQIFKPLVLMTLLFFTILVNNSKAQLPPNKININYNNLKLSSILDSLSVKFGINFSYNSELPTIKKNKSITVNARLEDILKILFQGEPLEYSILNKQIIISYITRLSNDESIGIKETYISIKGVVSDIKTLNPLAYASVAVSKKSLGTVTNNNGEFIIKLPNSYRFHDSLIFSYIGYQPECMSIDSLVNKKVNILLSENSTFIKQIVVTPVLGIEIIKEAVDKINDNYSNQNSMYTAFYRETNQENDEYISICEAVLNIAKSPYNSALFKDQAKIFKERKSTNLKKIQKLLFKLEGGVYNCIRLDVVKDRASFLSYDYFDSYDYKFIRKVSYNNRYLYQVEFDQKEGIIEPLYKGVIYVDTETKAIVAVKFGLSPRGMSYAYSMLVVEHPRRYQIKPLSTEYQIYYRFVNNKWALDYVRGEIRIKANNNKLFFNSTFTSVTEIAVTDIDTTNSTRFRWNEVVRPTDIMVDNSNEIDENYWGSYNVIQPEQPVIEAIKKLKLGKSVGAERHILNKTFLK
jgi:hypothetical protein